MSIYQCYVLIISEHFSDSNSLIKELKEVLYDGGTNFENVQFPTGKNGLDFVLTFTGISDLVSPKSTDGLSNVGGDIPKHLPSVPVFIFSNNVQVNNLTLRYVATKTGGQYFDLLKNPNVDGIADILRVSERII